jgi:hypothetical protein
VVRYARCRYPEGAKISPLIREAVMKKVLIALVASLVAISVSGCAGYGFGKGKAPPPRVVTKG